MLSVDRLRGLDAGAGLDVEGRLGRGDRFRAGTRLVFAFPLVLTVPPDFARDFARDVTGLLRLVVLAT